MARDFIVFDVQHTERKDGWNEVRQIAAARVTADLEWDGTFFLRSVSEEPEDVAKAMGEFARFAGSGMKEGRTGDDVLCFSRGMIGGRIMGETCILAGIPLPMNARRLRSLEAPLFHALKACLGHEAHAKAYPTSLSLLHLLDENVPDKVRAMTNPQANVWALIHTMQYLKAHGFEVMRADILEDVPSIQPRAAFAAGLMTSF